MLDSIRQKGLFAPGEGVLVACSGGRDSIFLAEALRRLGAQLAIGHVEHGLRGAASLEDRDFVRRFARQRGLPYFERRLALKGRKAPEGIEALARRERYLALEAICTAEGFAKLATAHQRDDQVETVLLRVLQGSDPLLWSGIEESRPLHRGSPITLIRPILDLGREEIAAWLRREGIAYREDETNRQPRFLRNRLRLALESLSPPRRQALAGAVAEVQRKAAALRSLAERLAAAMLRRSLRAWPRSLSLDLSKIPPLPAWVVEPVGESLLRRLGGKAPRGTVRALGKLWREKPRRSSGRSVLDPGGVRARRVGNTLEFQKI